MSFGGLPRRFLALLALVVPAAVHAAATAAGDAPAVLVISDRPGDPLAARVRAEFEALGFPTATGAAARQAQATVRIPVPPADITVSAGAPESAFAIQRHEDEPVAIVAVRTVEAVRALLLAPVRPPEPPPPPPPAAPSAPAIVTPPPPVPPEPPVDPAPPVASVAFAPPGFETALGASALWSPGGLGVAGNLSLAAAWRPIDSLRLGLDLRLPLVGPELSGPEGKARARLTWLGLGADWVFTGGAGRLMPRAGAGVAGAMMSVTGVANPPYSGSEERIETALLFARGGLGVRLHEKVGAGFEVLAAWAMPRFAVNFGERRAATWGGPLLTGTLSLEVAIP